MSLAPGALHMGRRHAIALLALLTACKPGARSESLTHEPLPRPLGVEPGPSVPPVPASLATCSSLPTAAQLRTWLRAAPEQGDAGGLAGGKFEWAAVVNRAGELCAVAVTTDDPSAAWPGSQGIAKAKAYTANAFSTDTTPLSTARLYTLSQPGHSLWGIAAGNPVNPACLSTPADVRGIGQVCGGTVAFGGGVALYRNQKRIGGLGVSGDTACADHEIAKRMRTLAGLNPPSGVSADDILYRNVDPPSVYAHPLCPNTWRDGKRLGDET